MKKSASQFEIWAQLCVTRQSVQEIQDFFAARYSIRKKYLISSLHLTIYHSRRPMFGVEEIAEGCELSLNTADTRFMVFAPGGENPKPDLTPGEKKIGIRITRTSEFRDSINQYRSLFLNQETPKILGSRRPSTKSRNAFGARHFQPHIAILRAGSGIITDLSEVGKLFRERVGEIHFDKFIVEKRKNF